MIFQLAILAFLSIVMAAVEPLEQVVEVEEATTPKFAYVTMLCDPADDYQIEYLRMMLVLKESIRQFDQENDIIAMVRGSIKEEQWELLDGEGFKIITVDDVGTQVSDPEPLRVPEDISACYRAKLNAVALTQYEKVIFLDNDMLLKQDISFMFEGSDFLGFAGHESPLNTGLFAVRPSMDAFDDLQRIASSDDFHPESGWGGYGLFPHWKLEGHMSDWSFWCAHTDQGLLYYYFDKVVHQASILPMKVGMEYFTHFTGWKKPVLHNTREMKTKAGVDSNNDSQSEWYSLWGRVQDRLDTSTVFDTAKDTKPAVAESRLRRTLATVDPYCDMYADVTLELFNADTDMSMGPLPPVIDGCASNGYTIVAMPPCKEKVKFKLLKSGVQVFKNTEGVPPMSLNGDSDDGLDDLYPLDQLKVEGSYSLEINPVPGAKTKFYFDVSTEGC